MAVKHSKFTPYEDAESIFEILNWELSPEEIKKTADEIMEKIIEDIEEVEEIPAGERNFSNTIWRRILKYADYMDTMSTITFPGSISTDKEVRNASTEARQKLSDFFVEIELRESLYNAVMEFVNKEEPLDPVDQRLVDFIVRDYKRNGFHLDKEVRDKLKTLWQESQKLGIQFRQNVNEDDTQLEFSSDELDGTPSNIIDSLEQKEDGTYVVELSGPNLVGITENCTVPATRKAVLEAWYSRCMETNAEILDRLVVLRDEAAKLLGYENHAEYVLEVKMAKNPVNVMEFLTDLIEQLKPFGEKEKDLLSELKREELGDDADTTIYNHDRSYYTKMWKEREFDVNMEKVKNYFPLTHVVNAMLEFYQEIFGFTFVQIEDAPVWHPDVTCYAIYDDQTEVFKGIFYLDLYPRPGTYGHAAAFTLVKGRELEDGSYHPTASAMVCNFNKPTEDQPSLLTLGQVRTLFHEFGHIVHQTTTTAKHYKFSGSSVQRDFVEAPSQMLENWIYEEEVITRISKHYETGEHIPLDMIERLRKYNRAMPGLTNLRQLFFGTFDMTIHTMEEADTAEIYNSLMEEVTLLPAPEGTNASASFAHLAGGYDAGYYGYMWSLVIAQDLYTRFKEEGPTSQEVGMDYRKYILEPGYEKDADKLVRDYLGRDFNNDAFLEYLGLK